MTHVLKNTAAAEGCEQLYLNEDLADVRFLFNINGDIQKVPANKANLAILSPVFKTMFFGSLKEKDEVLITDADADGFKEFLQFFYRGEVTLSMENIETVFRMADKYDVLERVNTCVAFLQSQLTTDNICWGYQLAVTFKNDKLMKFCEDKITKRPKEVFATNGFEGCGKNILERILKMNLICKEIDIFDACLAWAKCACIKNGLDETDAANLKTQLGDCLKLIRFGSMRSDEFAERYMLQKGIFTLEELEDIMLSFITKKYEPKIFNRTPRSYVWDTNNILRCNRKTETAGLGKFIKMFEITSFSSTQTVLLGEIHTAYTHNGSGSIVGTEIEVTITERVADTLHSNSSSNVIYKGTSKTWDGNTQLMVTLPNPILIQPQYIYDIQLKLPAIHGCTYFSASYCKQMVEMANGIIIQFHRNPTLDYDNQAEGWISYLFFNKV